MGQADVKRKGEDGRLLASTAHKKSLAVINHLFIQQGIFHVCILSEDNDQRPHDKAVYGEVA